MAHKAKLISYHGRKVKIDEDIAPLISNMWKLGINTISSCQAHCSFKCNHKYKVHPKDADGHQLWELIPKKYCRDNIWIAFQSNYDLELFYNAVAEYSKEDGSMYEFMCHGNWKENPREIWSTSWRVENAGVKGHWGRPVFSKGGKRSTFECWIDDDCKKNNFVTVPQLTFPHKHLSYVEERIALAIKKLKK